ncbi:MULTISPECIES: hypothetical protein [unclassified Lysobacter]
MSTTGGAVTTVADTKVVEVMRYSTHPGDAVRDRDAIIALWQGDFGPPAIAPDKYDHFYRDNPDGPAIIQLLRHDPDGELVGVISAGPRPVIWQGKAIRAGVVAYFAVAAGHRTLGPALLLQQSLLEAARGRFDLLYGLPRPSAVGVSRRAGFSVLGTLSRHAKVLRYGDYLQRRLPVAIARPVGALVDSAVRLRDLLAGGVVSDLHWRWSEHSDPRMDTLWHGSTHTCALTSVRDHALLRWRFDMPPAGRARYLLVSDDDDQLVAWFACDAHAALDQPLEVLDYWAADAMTGIHPKLIRVLVAAARAQRRSAIHLLLTADEQAMAGWRAAGFVARSGQPLIGMWLNPDISPQAMPVLHMTWLEQDS